MRRVSTKVVAVSAVGTGHRKTGSPCQDAVAKINSATGAGVCLCDGAGSATESRTGAIQTAEGALPLIATRFNSFWKAPADAAHVILTDCQDRLRELAQESRMAFTDYACTLLFVFVQVRRQRVRYLCGNLGDGIIVARRDNDLQVVLGAENSEFANQTWFVTSSDADQHFRIVAGEFSTTETPGWLLSTDGAAPFLYGEVSKRFAPAVMCLLEDLRKLKTQRVESAAESLVEELVPRTNDDCSIGMLQLKTRSGRHSKRIRRKRR